MENKPKTIVKNGKVRQTVWFNHKTQEEVYNNLILPRVPSIIKQAREMVRSRTGSAEFQGLYQDIAQEATMVLLRSLCTTYSQTPKEGGVLWVPSKNIADAIIDATRRTLSDTRALTKRGSLDLEASLTSQDELEAENENSRQGARGTNKPRPSSCPLDDTLKLLKQILPKEQADRLTLEEVESLLRIRGGKRQRGLRTPLLTEIYSSLRALGPEGLTKLIKDGEGGAK